MICPVSIIAFWRQLYQPNKKTLQLYLKSIDKKRFMHSDIADCYTRFSFSSETKSTTSFISLIHA